MRGGISTIRSQPDFEAIIVFYAEKIFSQTSNGCVSGQYHTSLVRFAQTYFILCADHPFGNFSPYFRFIDFKRFTLQWVNRCTNGCYYYFLAGSDIWGPADNV